MKLLPGTITRRDLLLAANALAGAALLAAPRQAPADQRRLRVRFLDRDTAADLLDETDAYLARLGPAEISLKLKTAEPPTLGLVKRRIRHATQDWPDALRARTQREIEWLRPVFADLSFGFPGPVGLVLTDGTDDIGLPYTRFDAIVMPRDFVEQSDDEDFRAVLAHEFWHVYSRLNPAVRREAYALIGFRRVAEVSLPPSVPGSRRFTNPDAPRRNQAIDLSWGLRRLPISIVPVDYVNFDAWTPDVPQDLEQIFSSRWLVVASTPGAPPVDRLLEVGDPRVNGFWDKVTRNTDYINHPEEIMADNFALLVTGTREPAAGVAGERLLHRLRDVIRRAGHC